jgi:hypothetical protein
MASSPRRSDRIIREPLFRAFRPGGHGGNQLLGGVRLKPDLRMEKEFVDRAKAIRQGILQLRDSL